jgi:hypothetical protein
MPCSACWPAPTQLIVLFQATAVSGALAAQQGLSHLLEVAESYEPWLVDDIPGSAFLQQLPTGGANRFSYSVQQSATAALGAPWSLFMSDNSAASVAASVAASGVALHYYAIDLTESIDNVIVAGARDGPAYALRRADGQLAWTLPALGIPRPPQTLVLDLRPLATNGDLAFVGSTQPVLIGADPTNGSIRWQFNLTLGSTGWLAAKEDLVALVYAGGQVAVLDARSGMQRWLAPTEVSATFAPAIDEAALYLGGANGLFALKR